MVQMCKVSLEKKGFDHWIYLVIWYSEIKLQQTCITAIYIFISTSEVYLRYNAFQNERNLRKVGLRDNVNCVYQDLIKFNR